MERVINSQIELSERMSNMYVKFMSMSKEEQSPNYVNIKLRLLQQIWNRVEENHHILYNTYDREELRTTAYVSDDIYYNCEEVYTKTNIAMLEALQQFEQKRASTDENFQASVNKFTPIDVKIPAIKIPTFSGSYTEWYSFHDQFISLIHNNEALQEVQKLHYLKMHVVGEAAALLRHIPVTENNYKQAWERLKGRYSNRRIIANAYLQRLMNIRNCTHESASAIKYILDTTTDCLSGLNSVGVDTKNWDAIVVHIVVNKLDAGSLKQWEERIYREKTNEIPTFQTLVQFLEYRFRSLEGIQSKGNIRTKQVVHNIVNREEDKEMHEVVARRVHHANISRIIKCKYCKGEHYINKCQKFAGLTFKNKVWFTEKKQLCYNCLMSNHRVNECRIKIRCSICGKKHNSLIHNPPRDGDENKQQNIQSTREEGVNTHFVKENTKRPMLNMHFKTEEKNKMLLRNGKLQSNNNCKVIRKMTEQGKRYENMNKNAYKRDVEGRHIVKIPNKGNNVDFRNTYFSVNRKRLNPLERYPGKDERLKEKYRRSMNRTYCRIDSYDRKRKK